MAFNLSQKRGAFEVEIFLFFFKSDFFFCKSSFFFNFTGVEKTKEGDVLQNDYEKDASTEPIAGNFIVYFVCRTEDKIYFCSGVRLLSSVEPEFDYRDASPSKLT